jgi:hypothetical protein
MSHALTQQTEFISGSHGGVAEMFTLWVVTQRKIPEYRTPQTGFKST